MTILQKTLITAPVAVLAGILRSLPRAEANRSFA